MLELLHPEVEWVPIMGRLDGIVYRGHEGVARWLREFDDDWAEFRTEPHEFRDIADSVLTPGHLAGPRPAPAG
jgi:hypothetical protein